MIRRILLFTLPVFFATTTPAQQKVFENVRNFELRDAGKIMDNTSVRGYYFFYVKDQLDKDTEAFVVTLMDNDLNIVKTFDVLRAAGTQLVNATYNGTSFILVYFHEMQLEFVTYDKAGKVLGSTRLDYIPDHIQAQIRAAKQSGQDVLSFYVLDSMAWLRHSVVMNKRWGAGYEFEAYDASMKSLWRTGSPATSELDEIATIQYVSEKYIVAVIIRTEPGNMWQAYQGSSTYQVTDARTGQLVFEIPLRDSVSNWTSMHVLFDENRQRSIILGAYTPIGTESYKDLSTGLFITAIDMKGTLSGLRKYPWEGDLGKTLRNFDGNKDWKKPSVYFHTLYQGKTGNLLAIGEQYKTRGHIAVGGDPSRGMCDLELSDMEVLEFDSIYNLTQAFGITKKMHVVGTPPWINCNAQSTIARHMSYRRDFDFQFTSEEKTRDRMYAVYIDADRKGEDREMANVILGVISYEDGKTKSERIPLKTEAKSIWVDQGKPGYIMIVEYFKKKRRISWRLEKISY